MGLELFEEALDYNIIQSQFSNNELQDLVQEIIIASESEKPEIG